MDPSKTPSIESTTLSALLETIEEETVIIKIDVEGSECRVQTF